MRGIRAWLLPLAVVVSIGWSPGWVALGGSLASLGVWPTVAAIAVPLALVLLDGVLFNRRAAQPGFDPWDEI